jgi:desampylase
MGVTISRGVHDGLIAAASASPALEVCGLLFGSVGLIEDFAPVANVAADSASRFELDPAALIAAHRTARDCGPTIIGNFHSHPNGLTEPSRNDAEMMTGDGSIWAIVALGQVSLWRATPGGFAPQELRIVD